MWQVMGESNRRGPGKYAYLMDIARAESILGINADVEAWQWPVGRAWAPLSACLLMMDILNIRDYGHI